MAGVFTSLLMEMQRRKVFRVTAAYAVVAFIVLQLGEITFDPLQLPPWSLRALIVAVLLGFPIVVALSWMFELTPEGIRREKDSENTRRGLSTILLGTVLLLDGALAYYLYQVYAPGVMSEESQATAPIATLGELPEHPPGSIAVLPFADLSPQQDQQFFADGVAAELRSILTKVDGLQVAGRTSSSTLGADRSATELGNLLNVAWILQGSVRRDGNAVRVTAELTSTAAGILEWSDSIDGDVVNTLEIQDRIASEIVTEMLGNTDGLVTAMETRTDIASFDAYNTYLEARLTNPDASWGAQLLGMATIFAWTFVVSGLVWFVLKLIMGIRVDEEQEMQGVDWTECGLEAYPEFVHGGSK